MSLEIFAFFTLLSFLTSLLTSIFSVGGGLIMLVALAQSFSPGTLIPLHGAIQLFNNLSRTFIYKEFFNWSLIKNILISTLFGSFGGILLFGNVSEEILIWLIAATILFFTLTEPESTRCKTEINLKPKYFLSHMYHVVSLKTMSGLKL